MFKLSNLSSLQLFQIIRYGTFVLVGICFAQLHLAQSEIGQFETFILVSRKQPEAFGTIHRLQPLQRFATEL